jgi:hypothetical protein
MRAFITGFGAASVNAWLFLTAISSIAVADTGGEQSALHVLSEGYLHNRNSFDSIDCRFTLARTTARSTSEAIAGQFVGKTVSYACLWLVNKEYVRFEKKCPEDLKKETVAVMEKHAKSGAAGSSKGPSVLAIPCKDELLLRNRNSSYGLSYSELIECATLTPKGVRDEGGIRGTPFDMEVMAADEYSNPHRNLQDCISGRFDGKYVGKENVKGRNLEVVSLAHKGKQERMRFGFDPERGYLPVYISDRAPEDGYTLTYEAFITDARKCSGGRWFPTRCVVVYLRHSKVDGEIRVVEIKVTQLDVDNPPAHDRFDITIPAGFQVSVPSLDNQWLHVSTAITVGPGSLAQLHAMCADHGKTYLEKRKIPNDRPVLQSPGWKRFVAMGVGLVVILSCLFFIWIRKRQR